MGGGNRKYGSSKEEPPDDCLEWVLFFWGFNIIGAGLSEKRGGLKGERGEKKTGQVLSRL